MTMLQMQYPMISMIQPVGSDLKSHTPKNRQEILQIIDDVTTRWEGTGTEPMLDFHHIQLLVGGVEMNLFAMGPIQPVTNHLCQDTLVAWMQAQPTTDPNRRGESDDLHKPCTAADAEARHQQIEEAINYIFQYKHFNDSHSMATSPLQNLAIVAQARQAWLYKRGLTEAVLRERDKACALRNFLIQFIEEDFRPKGSDSIPNDLTGFAPDIRDQWVEYMILRWQYVDGKPRTWVESNLQATGYWVTGGTYTRYLQAARQHLAEVIWQKEMCR